MSSLNLIMSTIGWIGAILYLISHFYIIFITNYNIQTYYKANLIAGLSLSLSSFYISSWQPAFGNLIWAGISACVLAKIQLDNFNLKKEKFYFLFGSITSGILIVGFFYENNEWIANSFGWLGFFIYLIVYFLFSARTITQKEYMFWNVTAATTLLPYSTYQTIHQHWFCNFFGGACPYTI